MKPRIIPEKVEQEHIVRTLRLLRFEVYVLGHPSPADGRRFRGTGQTPGLPDLVAFSPLRVTDAGAGRDCVWIEVKRAGGRLRFEQAIFREQARQVGGRMHHVVGTLDAVIEWLVAERWAKTDAFPHYRQPKERTA